MPSGKRKRPNPWFQPYLPLALTLHCRFSHLCMNVSQELKDYILKRRDELSPKSGSGGGSGIITAAELMGETAGSSSGSSKKKGFA